LTPKRPLVLAAAAAPLLALGLWCVRAARAPRADEATQAFAPSDGPEQRYLQRWELLGPFGWRPAGAEAAASDLARVLDHPLFPGEGAAISAGLPPPEAGAGERRIRPVRTNNGQVELRALLASKGPAAAFATTELDSPRDMPAALLVEADDGARVWLNGAQVYDRAAVRRLQQFEDYVPVRLRRGRNRIAIKLASAGRRGGTWDGWSFAVGVRSLPGARAERAARSYLQELGTSLIGPGGLLDLDLRLDEPGQPTPVEILDGRRRPLQRLTLPGGARHRLPVAALADGLYFLRLPRGAAPEPFPFYKGDLAAVKAELVVAAARASPDDAAFLATVRALRGRLEHLTRPEHQERQSHLWQAKVALLLAQWSAMRDAVNEGRPPLRDVTGTHLRGLPSRVDGADQYYLLHVPRGYARARGPVPLVIIMPYMFETLRPFLESIPVAEISVLGTIARIADDNGLAFLWMDNRGNTAGSDLGEADMLDVVDQVARDYAVDRARIYLFGSCAGGREALSLAAKYPDRFAAVGTMSPSATFLPAPPERPTDAHAGAAYRHKSPLARLENLAHVPVFVLHGDENDHNPLAESLRLRDAAAAAGVDLQLEIVPGATHLRFPADPRAVIFRRFAGRRRAAAPDRVVLATPALRYARAYWVEIESFVDPRSEARIEARYQDGEVRVETKNVGRYRLDHTALPASAGGRGAPERLTVWTNGQRSVHPAGADVRVAAVSGAAGDPALDGRKTAAVGGPIWDLFTGPFLVVVGTGGGAAQAQAARAQAERFSRSWRARFLGHRPAKPDRALTEDDVRDNHLVVFGAIHPASRLGPPTHALPFRQRPGALVGPGDEPHDGPVSAQYIVPNPLAPQRYLLVATTDARVDVPADGEQLALKGWYDYSLWRSEGVGPASLVDVGVFDHTWTRALSAVTWP
jgi:dienelactone hydrolase